MPIKYDVDIIKPTFLNHHKSIIVNGKPYRIKRVPRHSFLIDLIKICVVIIVDTIIFSLMLAYNPILTIVMWSDPLFLLGFSLNGLFITYLLLLTIIGRIRDLDASHWLLLFLIIPLLNIIFLIVLLLIKGTEGDNRYGPDYLEIKGDYQYYISVENKNRWV
jgi:uncharacterized membrane protein YhaH (DUF805 family)